MNDKELNKKFDAIEKRLEKLEQSLFESTSLQTKSKTSTYEGLTGGIRFLLNNNFFDKPKNLSEVVDELKRKGYHYPKESISTSLIRQFVKSKRALTRIKENAKWNYVKRK